MRGAGVGLRPRRLSLVQDDSASSGTHETRYLRLFCAFGPSQRCKIKVPRVQPVRFLESALGPRLFIISFEASGTRKLFGHISRTRRPSHRPESVSPRRRTRAWSGVEACQSPFQYPPFPWYRALAPSRPTLIFSIWFSATESRRIRPIRQHCRLPLLCLRSSLYQHKAPTGIRD